MKPALLPLLIVTHGGLIATGGAGTGYHRAGFDVYGVDIGSMFGMCRHREQGRPWTVTGHGGGKPSAHSMKPLATDFWRYMDMPWMEGRPPYGVAQAIPPAYTEWIGVQLLQSLSCSSVERTT